MKRLICLAMPFVLALLACSCTKRSSLIEVEPPVAEPISITSESQFNGLIAPFAAGGNTHWTWTKASVNGGASILVQPSKTGCGYDHLYGMEDCDTKIWWTMVEPTLGINRPGNVEVTFGNDSQVYLLHVESKEEIKSLHFTEAKAADLESDLPALATALLASGAESTPWGYYKMTEKVGFWEPSATFIQIVWKDASDVAHGIEFVPATRGGYANQATVKFNGIVYRGFTTCDHDVNVDLDALLDQH